MSVLRTPSSLPKKVESLVFYDLIDRLLEHNLKFRVVYHVAGLRVLSSLTEEQEAKDQSTMTLNSPQVQEPVTDDTLRAQPLRYSAIEGRDSCRSCTPSATQTFTH